MLVLSRKVGEKIRIGDDIVLTVVRVLGEKVRLGIEAPPEVPIHREEVHLRLQREAEAARHEGASPATDTDVSLSSRRRPR